MASARAPERSKIEQIVLEFFAKSLHIILESRIPALYGGGDESTGSSASGCSSGPKTRDRWFNLALGDCTSALENFEPWRRSFSDPLVVDILLVQPKSFESNMPPMAIATSGRHWFERGSSFKGVNQGSPITGEETILERWTVQFESRKGNSACLGLGSTGARAMRPDMKRGSNASPTLELAEVQEISGKNKEALPGPGVPGNKTFQETDKREAAVKGVALPVHVIEVPAVYKRTVIMFRSLYSSCRLLPAYRLFRLANTSSHSCSFTLTYRVLSSVPAFSEHDERDMSTYSFTPVETAFGRMQLSVTYRYATAVTASEVTAPILPRIIADYVGSPTTDPLKSFPGEPHSLPSSGISRSRGINIVSIPSSAQDSPPGPIFGRRHSWSGRVDQIQPALQPPLSPSYGISRSPSPPFPLDNIASYSASPYSPYSRKYPSRDSSSSPLSSPLTAAYRLSGVQPTHSRPSQPILSPPFSPSSSPSPPTSYSQAGVTSKGPLRPGSAPVSIPKPYMSRGPRLPIGELQQHSRSSLPPRSPQARQADSLLRTSSESLRFSRRVLSHTQQSTSFESPLQLRMLQVDYGQKVHRSEGAGPLFTIENISRGHSQLASSRVPSKIVFRDDGDDDDFSCPFAVDDDVEQRSSKTDNMQFSDSSTSSVQGILHQRDAAVGALIRMLKSAPPLRQLSYHPAVTADLPVTFIEGDGMSGGALDSVIRNWTGELQAATCEMESGVLRNYWKRTAFDALEELQEYKKMRDHMLSHGAVTEGS